MFYTFFRIIFALIITITMGSGLFVRPTGAELNLSTAIVEVAKKAMPSVVHIEVTQRQEVAVPLLPFQNAPFFRYFFEQPGMPRKFEEELKAVGTGMMLDPQGHILSNNHVVAGATSIKVLLEAALQ